MDLQIARHHIQAHGGDLVLRPQPDGIHMVITVPSKPAAMP